MIIFPSEGHSENYTPIIGDNKFVVVAKREVKLAKGGRNRREASRTIY